MKTRFRLSNGLLATTLAVLSVITFMLLTSCSWLSPEQKATLVQDVATRLANGEITQAQYDAFINALSSKDWSGIIDIATSIGVSLVAAFTGIQIHTKRAAKKAAKVA